MKTFASAALLSVVALSQEIKPIYATPIDKLIEETNGDTSDAGKSFQEICIENGFDFETHTVVTDDGYILSVFRIPGLTSETDTTTSKPPILMQHGILDSANCWIMNYADVAPAFVAARAGYDVWLGNSRGNTYSRAHTEYDPDKNEKKFWNFSWYEMGQYDIPAVIDTIQAKTGGQKVAYIGHSQGTTQMFSALSENSAYFADKVPLYVALGPVSKITNTSDAIFHLAGLFYDDIARTLGVLGIHELLGATWFTSGVSDLFCSHIAIVCELIGTLFISHNPSLDDNTRFAVYMGHEPNGTSVKSILHYAQNMKEDRFQVFSDDYTDIFAGDKKRHTDLIPLENIQTVPVAIFTGIEDPLADITDAEWTRDQIGDNVVYYEEMQAGHLTFMIGKDMTYFTTTVMDLLQQYHPLPSSEAETVFLQ